MEKIPKSGGKLLSEFDDFYRKEFPISNMLQAVEKGKIPENQIENLFKIDFAKIISKLREIEKLDKDAGSSEKFVSFMGHIVSHTVSRFLAFKSKINDSKTLELGQCLVLATAIFHESELSNYDSIVKFYESAGLSEKEVVFAIARLIDKNSKKMYPSESFHRDLISSLNKYGYKESNLASLLADTENTSISQDYAYDILVEYLKNNPFITESEKERLYEEIKSSILSK